VARLATVSPRGHPHLVPVVFAVDAETVWTGVDQKPKASRALRRLEHIAAHPRVSLLVDHYEEDWTLLWWVRADGPARLVPAEAAADGLAALVAKYPQYRADPPRGPFIRVEVDAWSAWSASPLS
jgi:PPOX class probable F420-dependent enzyme